MFVEQRTCSHLRTAAHAPLDRAGLPFDSVLLPRHHVHRANARTFLLVIFGYEHLHPVVASPLLDVSSTGNLAADSPLDHHLNASMPLTEGPGIAVSVGYFVPLLVTSGGNTYILLFTDRFSRRARMFAVTAAEFTAEGTTNIIIDRYIPLWGCPRNIRSEKKSPALLKAFACRLQASWRPENYHQLLPPKWQWSGGACDPHDTPNAGNGGQGAPK